MKSVSTSMDEHKTIKKIHGNTGKKRSEKVKRKMSVAQRKGKRWTKESRKKHSEMLKKQWEDPEYREMMSEVNIKNWENSEYREMMGEIFRETVKKRWEDPEYREMMSKVRTKNWENPEFREKMSGENNHFYVHGLSHLPYSKKWSNQLKKRIRKRDNNRCVLCHKKGDGRKLSVHHIDYDKENCHPSNLITLCSSCHISTNHNDRHEWIKKFNYIMFG